MMQHRSVNISGSAVQEFTLRSIFCMTDFQFALHFPPPDIEFKEGETEHTVEVEILYDGVREMREAFMVHLKPDENMVAEIQVLAEQSTLCNLHT